MHLIMSEILQQNLPLAVLAEDNHISGSISEYFNINDFKIMIIGWPSSTA